MCDSEKLKSWFAVWEIDPYPLMIKMFQGIQYEKSNNPDRYYSSKPEDIMHIIKFYYCLVYDSISFDNLKKAFVTKYVNNESKLECAHDDFEIDGLRIMYEHIYSGDIEENFDIFTLKDLHQKLFSKAPNPEFGGTIRNDVVFLPGTGIELCDWRMITRELIRLDDDVLKELKQRSKDIRKSRDINALINYLGDCVVLGCNLVKIHPFFDGNGRTVRGFINKMFDDAGLPPVYIKLKEKLAYNKAMSKAILENNYDDIKNFYLFKICDSIIELDIIDRAKRKTLVEPNDKKVKKLGTIN